MTQPPENAELAVTQEDRDAAVMLAALWQTKSVPMHGHAIDTKDGRCDHTPIVQAFARHRLASPVVPFPDEAAVERAKDAVKAELADQGFTDPEWDGSDSDAEKVARAALTAALGVAAPDGGRS